MTCDCDDNMFCNDSNGEDLEVDFSSFNEIRLCVIRRRNASDSNISDEEAVPQTNRTTSESNRGISRAKDFFL